MKKTPPARHGKQLAASKRVVARKAAADPSTAGKPTAKRLATAPGSEDAGKFTPFRLTLNSRGVEAAKLPAFAGWEVKASHEIGAARDGGHEENIEIHADDVLEIGLEDGAVLYLCGDEAQEWLGLEAPKGRGEGATDGAILLGTAILPREGEAQQRDGALKWIIKSLRVFGSGPEGMTALALAGTAQDSILGSKPGMYRCAVERFELTAVEKVGPADSPILLFIHGTASSTSGSFGHLWTDNAEEARSLFGDYRDRIYALQHRTLTESPIRNALDAAMALPPGARLHVVSHSRGGMVGELLARGGSTQVEPIDDDDLAVFEKDTKDYKGDIDLLRQLRKVLRGKRIVVERHVRVACPARGTTLASERLDRWANVAFHLMRLAGKSVAGGVASLVATPVAGAAVAAKVDAALDAFNSFLLAVVKERTEPQVLPGIEAMMPDSALVRMLNRPRPPVAGRLYVIAGDYEGESLLTRFGNWVSDTFYGGQNDLVVNTASMTGGAARVDGVWRAFFHGAHTHNLRYFEEADSRRQLRLGLAGKTSGFENWDGQVEQAIARGARKQANIETAESIVFLLPGIMGSHIGIAGGAGRVNRIWFDPLNMFKGDIEDLAYEGRNEAKIRPDGAFEQFYGDLHDRLTDQQYGVIDFAYDWRRSIADQGKQFGSTLAKALAKPGRPVRILAHSMGGLVTRMAFATTPGLWEQFSANPGNRILMLGTPNQGSHSIASVLLGRDDFVRKIERFDPAHSMREFLQIVSAFPGVLELLPAPTSKPEFDYFDRATWTDEFLPNDDLKNGQPKHWSLPTQNGLDDAKGTWAKMDAWIDANPSFLGKVVYVAGQAPTPHLVEIVDGKIEILTTEEGDGRVLWKTGLLGGRITRVWYAQCSHGDLPANRDAFDAYVELLEKGDTSKLPTIPPAVRAAVASKDAPEPRLPQRGEGGPGIYPSPSDLMAAAMGARPRAIRGKAAPPTRLKVLVRHGTFAYSDAPVMIGHYEGDTIDGSEAYLDSLLQGRLVRSRDLGIHPQQPGEAAVFIASEGYNRPSGAVVVGLGRMGNLSPGDLTRTVQKGALTYITEAGDDPVLEDAPGRLQVSMLIIGSGYYGLSVRDALAAALQGIVEANRIVARQTDKHLRPIGKVCFYERQLDRALSAMACVIRLEADVRFRGALDVKRPLDRVDGGYETVQISELESNWQRLQVIETDGLLAYTVLSDGSRNTIEQVVTQPRLIEQLIDRSIANTTEDPRFSRALFELLVPPRLKHRAPENNGFTLMLDKKTARYPWEMLRDVDATANSDLGPLATRIGFVRQFHAVGMVPSVQHPKAQSALVVGDPSGPLNLNLFPPLEGARREARHVADALEKGAFRVTRSIADMDDTKCHGADILTAIVGTEFRVLHLSGHGVLDFDSGQLKCDACGKPKPDKQKISGMVLDDDVFFSAAEVEALPYVPELVFINCCHLGKFGVGDNAAFDLGRATLATGLAEAFVRKGAKVVVAAGWAVDDAAAVTFAETFYEKILGGESLGNAVRQARTTTYLKHPRANTWGAYQVYGNEAYRMRGRRATNEDASSTSAYFDRKQVLDALDRVRADAAVANASAIAALRRRLQDLEVEVAHSGVANVLGEADIQESLGHTWADLGDFARALEYFDKAVAGDQKKVEMRLFERRANLLARHGWNLVRQANGDTDQIKAGLESIETGIQAAEALCVFRKSGERLSILGAAHKRKALALTATGRKADALKALQSMAQAFAEAHTVQPNSYAFLNLIQSMLLVGKQPDITKEDLDQIGKIAVGSGGQSFWELAHPADAALTLRVYMTFKSGEIEPTEWNEVQDRYVALLRRAGSPVQSASVIDQLDAMERLLPPKPPELRKQLRKLLDAIAI